MKANELRILNLILYRGLPNYVCSIQSPMPSKQKRFDGKFIVEINPPDTFNVAIDEIEPIPLTEEWLVKFGFKLQPLKNNTKEWYFIARGKFSMNNERGFWSHSPIYLEDVLQIQYVHQLQNLYFALTGEELTIKENADTI